MLGFQTHVLCIILDMYSPCFGWGFWAEDAICAVVVVAAVVVEALVQQTGAHLTGD